MREAFRKNPKEIAAIILEPIPANAGLYFPQPGFLEALREECTEHGALLIFDEVMTGFRVARGGAQEIYGVRPDLTALGKVIGGGLPVGAFGGRAEIMDQLSPLGPVYQAGTLSGNPLAMAAGSGPTTRAGANRRLEPTRKTRGAARTGDARSAGKYKLARRFSSHRFYVLPLLYGGSGDRSVEREAERSRQVCALLQPLSRRWSLFCALAVRDRIPLHRASVLLRSTRRRESFAKRLANLPVRRIAAQNLCVLVV